MFTKSPRVLLGIVLILAVLLSACGGVAGDSWAGITADDRAVYVSFGKRLVALNPTSGATLWEYPDEDDRDAMFYALPAIADGMIYIGDYKGRLHAINQENGESVWVYEPEKNVLIGPLSTTAPDRIISGVALDEERLYFGLGSRNVVAISRENGEEVWTFETDHGVWATPLLIPANPDDEDSQPLLYVASLDHHLYALHPETGKEVWKLDMGGAAPGNMTYDPERNWIYVGTLISELLAIDLSTHEIADRYETEDWIWGGPALDGDMLYFGDLLGNLYAVKIVDNQFVREWQREVATDAIRSTPILTDGLIIVGSQDHFVYAVSKQDGSQEWSKKTRGEVLTNLVFVPGEEEEADLIIAGTSEPEELVIGFKSESGDVDWRYSDKD